MMPGGLGPNRRKRGGPERPPLFGLHERSELAPFRLTKPVSLEQPFFAARGAPASSQQTEQAVPS